MRELPHPPQRFVRIALVAGALVLVPAVAVPWITAKIMLTFAGNFGASTVVATFTPWQVYRLLGLPPYLTAVWLVLVGGTCLPGLLFSVWLRGPIRTSMQQAGVWCYSIWLLLVTTAHTYAVAGLLADRLILQRMLHIERVWYWHVEPGLMLWLLAQILLWSALVQLWREMPYSPLAGIRRRVERRVTPRAGSLMLSALGGICWCIGFFGLYWYLPDGCLAPLPFGTPPYGIGACVNRIDTRAAIVSLVAGRGGLAPAVGATLYWVLGTAVVLGGVLLFAYLWRRPSPATPLHWVLVWMCAWSGSLLLLTGAGTIGAMHLAALYRDEQITGGCALSLLGDALVLVGLAVCWRETANTCGRGGTRGACHTSSVR